MHENFSMADARMSFMPWRTVSWVVLAAQTSACLPQQENQSASHARPMKNARVEAAVGLLSLASSALQFSDVEKL